MKEYKQKFQVAGKEIEVETGKIARQSQGAVTIKMGGTVILATATVDKNDTELDYFPLGVEYIEKMYARGAISGSRFRKREGMPSDEAIIKAREVDHSIRSLFPKSWKRPVSVVLTVLAYDGENDPQALTVLGASLAVMQSGVPFYGPCASVVIALDSQNNVVINPSALDREENNAEFIISGVDDKLLSFEGWGKEIPEEIMNKVLDEANEAIKIMNSEQRKFIEEVGQTLKINLEDYPNKPAGEELISDVKTNFGKKIEEALFNPKTEREMLLDTVKAEIVESYKDKEDAPSKMDINNAVEYVARKILRDSIMTSDKRVSGRKLDEIRDLKAEIGYLPTVHGSAIFARGETQSLSIVTLAPKSSELLIDDMEGEETKAFFHHYNMPPYASGEAGRFSYHPGRREVGHGAIGENAIKVMLPSQEEFPYTIRTVSEIMASNGSTSMAATCASSLALLAAGVPLKEQVAGIGVGLITDEENVENHKLILDIEGIEDFYGDMDFKVCGTKNGVTAIQYENKLQGVPLDIIKKAFEMAKSGRAQVLEVMNKVISQPADLPENAPKVETLSIEKDQIGELIGPGGKVIRELIERANEHGKYPVDIAVDDFGVVTISAVNSTQLNFVKESIAGMFKKPTIGEEFDGVVDKIVAFGAFVKLTPNLSGLLHVSEMSDKFVKDPNEIVKEGQTIRVKVKSMERGKISLTAKI